MRVKDKVRDKKEKSGGEEVKEYIWGEKGIDGNLA